MISKVSINNITSYKQSFLGNNSYVSQKEDDKLDFNSQAVKNALDKYTSNFFYSFNRPNFQPAWQKLSPIERRDFVNAVNFIEQEKLSDNSFVSKQDSHQCDNGYKSVASKKKITDDLSIINYRIMINQDLISNLSRVEEIEGETIAWVKGAPKIYITNQDFYPETKDVRINSQIEIVNSPNGEPDYALYLKPSTILDGVFEITRYDFKNYDENINVIEEIKAQTLQGGVKLAYVTLKADGVVEYFENFELDGVKTSRKYSHKVNPKGGIFSYEYQYKITDENNETILDINRSFENNPNGNITTKVGDVTYIATYDEKDFVFEITDNKGNVWLFDLKKFASRDENDEFNYSKLYELCKKCPADLLIQVLEANELDGITICKNSYDSKISARHKYHITTGNDLFQPFAHEVGHLVDVANLKESRLNKNLIDTYIKECENFVRENPENIAKFIEYFSQTSPAQELPASNAHQVTRGMRGFGELFAETNILTKTYGSTSPLGSRDMYLVRYFPKTIALIAKELGY